MNKVTSIIRYLLKCFCFHLNLVICLKYLNLFTTKYKLVLVVFMTLTQYKFKHVSYVKIESTEIQFKSNAYLGTMC